MFVYISLKKSIDRDYPTRLLLLCCYEFSVKQTDISEDRGLVCWEGLKDDELKHFNVPLKLAVTTDTHPFSFFQF